MTQVHDHLLPISCILSRLENHRDHFREHLARTPWWRRRRIAVLSGMVAAYSYEIEQLLEISARWQPAIAGLSARRTDKREDG